MADENVAKRIKMLRESKGATQREVAEALGLRKNTYAHYEDGSNGIKITVVAKIAEYYGVTVDWLLGTGEYAKSPPPEDRWESIRKMLETFPEQDFQEVLSFLKFIEWRINERNK